VAVEKSVFLRKVENWAIQNVEETGKNRLQSFLTRSSFCEIEVSEFFNSHRVYHHPFHTEIAGSKRISQTYCVGEPFLNPLRPVETRIFAVWYSA
jgi:hypothetical protein